MKFNKVSHLTYRIPKKQKMDQRISWHIDHAEHFGYSTIPGNLKVEIERRK